MNKVVFRSHVLGLRFIWGDMILLLFYICWVWDNIQGCYPCWRVKLWPLWFQTSNSLHKHRAPDLQARCRVFPHHPEIQYGGLGQKSWGKQRAPARNLQRCAVCSAAWVSFHVIFLRQTVRAPNMVKNENVSEQDNLTESKLIDPSDALKLTTQAGLDPAPCWDVDADCPAPPNESSLTTPPGVPLPKPTLVRRWWGGRSGEQRIV